MVNAWDEPMADVGPKGEDHGKGGKYLLLPPDFKGEPPSAYFTLRFPTYNGYSLFRAIRAGSTEADVTASRTVRFRPAPPASFLYFSGFHSLSSESEFVSLGPVTREGS